MSVGIFRGVEEDEECGLWSLFDFPEMGLLVDNGLSSSCILNKFVCRNMLLAARVLCAMGSGRPRRLLALGNFPELNKILDMSVGSIKFELRLTGVLKFGKSWLDLLTFGMDNNASFSSDETPSCSLIKRHKVVSLSSRGNFEINVLFNLSI